MAKVMAPGKGHTTGTANILLEHDGKVVAHIKPGEPSELVRGNLHANSFLHWSSGEHISFQREHITAACDYGVELVRLKAKNGDEWTTTLDRYVESHVLYDHKTRGTQWACPLSKFFYQPSNQGRLF